jgi:hypothetical protein
MIAALPWDGHERGGALGEIVVVVVGGTVVVVVLPGIVVVVVVVVDVVEVVDVVLVVEVDEVGDVAIAGVEVKSKPTTSRPPTPINSPGRQSRSIRVGFTLSSYL